MTAPWRTPIDATRANTRWRTLRANASDPGHEILRARRGTQQVVGGGHRIPLDAEDLSTLVKNLHGASARRRRRREAEEAEDEGGGSGKRGTGATCERIPDAETRESDRRHTSSLTHFSTCSARSSCKVSSGAIRRSLCTQSPRASDLPARTAMVRARRGPAVPRSTAKLEDSEPGEAELSIPSTWREDISTAVASTSTDPGRARRTGGEWAHPTRFQKPLTARARPLPRPFPAA